MHPNERWAIDTPEELEEVIKLQVQSDRRRRLNSILTVWRANIRRMEAANPGMPHKIDLHLSVLATYNEAARRYAVRVMRDVPSVGTVEQATLNSRIARHKCDGFLRRVE